jgi:hypothetical protein
MKVTGTVTRVTCTGGPAWGTSKPYRRVTLARDEGGREIALKYLASFPGRPDWDVARGQRITIEGMAMIGNPRVNIGGVTVTVHAPETRTVIAVEPEKWYGEEDDTGPGEYEPEHVSEPRTDAEWLYGNSPGGLRMQAAEALADEFGTDVSEWTV